MKYAITPHHIPQDRRAEFNEKILFAIDNGKDEIPRSTIFNCYTGIGGLHGLKMKDFDCYREYSQAKKELEMGQFFTPHELCREMIRVVQPQHTERVLDLCCGMGNFFNDLPNPFNAYGLDCDPNATKVARHLYPDATISTQDIRTFKPTQRFDLLLGNPPYNLEFERELSQFYYCKKAHEVLTPAGIMAIIVPVTFLQSEFWDKSQVRSVEKRFHFIGQTKLAPSLFAASGVEDFQTKLLIFARETDCIPSTPYAAEEFVTMDQLQERIAGFRVLKQSLQLKLHRENNVLLHAEAAHFNYKVGKYLYELKAHPHLRRKYDKAVALVSKFRNQQPPENCTQPQYDEWERRKLTPAKVLAVIRRYIRNQYLVPRKEVALVRTRYGYKLKGYAPHLLDDIKDRFTPMYRLILDGEQRLPQAGKWMTPRVHEQYRQAARTIRRKQREFLRQSRAFDEIKQDPALAHYIDTLRFYNKELELCEFTPLQKFDMNRAFQKNNLLLNWQQGSGKTAVAYHFAKRLRAQKRIHNPIVLAPANAVEMTWIPFLQRQNKRYVQLRKSADLDRVRPGEVIVVSLSMLERLERDLQRFLKRHARKVCLVFDESDEITNDASQRTVRTLHIFRRVKFKILATGTMTRNNVAEQYSQLELLYNNSIYMMCDCETVYFEQKCTHDIYSEANDYQGQPFPARGGAVLFKACFCPGKTTVFGIEKRTQDIYNKDHLWKLICKTIITRKFREFAGDKYEICTHNVTPSEGEKAVYNTILKEFCRICAIYFTSTGDAKKDAGLRISRQMKLLIKACSVAHTMPDYFGNPFPQKVRDIAQMVREIPEKVAIGCTSIEALDLYADYMRTFFAQRPLFVIQGAVGFKQRLRIIDQFEATASGILVSTQQSLKSSINIPTCNEVILESMQWNIPRMEQYYFRFVRLDSKQKKHIHFVLNDQSIEQNLMALITTKERLNEFVKTGEVKDQAEIFEEFDVPVDLIDNLLRREKDQNGGFYFSWAGQRIAA